MSRDLKRLRIWMKWSLQIFLVCTISFSSRLWFQKLQQRPNKWVDDSLACEPCHMCHMIIINSLAPLPDQPLTHLTQKKLILPLKSDISTSFRGKRKGGEKEIKVLIFFPKPNQLPCCLLPIGSKFLRQHPNWKESSNNRVGMLNNFVDHTDNTFTE